MASPARASSRHAPAGEASPAGRPATRLAWFPPTTGVNPYQELLYTALAGFGIEAEEDASFEIRWLWRARRRVSFLHFHWRTDRYYDWPTDWRCWHPPPALRRMLVWVKLASFVARLRLARALGYRIAWTVHDVYPKNPFGRRLHRVAARSLARSAHVLLAHDRATADRARAELGRSLDGIRVVPHGSYVGYYPPGRPAAEVRAELGIDDGDFLFLYFGIIRREKEVELLLEAFSSLDRRDVALAVAGDVRDPSLAAVIEWAALADPRVRPLLSLVPEERVAELFGASDAAVFPRSNGWTSGSLILALSLGLPVVAARVAAYEELVSEAAGWLFAPGDRDSLATTLAAVAADRDLARAKGEAALRIAHGLSWRDSAEATAAALRDSRS